LYHYDMESNQILPIFTVTFNSSETPYKQYYLLNEQTILTNVFGRGLVATDLKSRTSSYIKVVNDYFGNMPAPMGIVQVRNGYWVYNIQPEEMMDAIKKRLAESDCTEKDRQALNQTLAKLKENTNNVVLFGKLKKRIEIERKFD